ncbi:WAS/WASL-interacting protein family member 1-like isoform X2 [Trachypithecus francoisi]|uniref:WAS/WASL-interacting protein family member 1-like isoform X2 n=1 Tax=Trachypithecus francoisi TaxID=54180 RepID=UPI00141B0973|nr:WAS/WASL-interacting protein family member 1-like isoform X2 [Trachypithecus francoisi]
MAVVQKSQPNRREFIDGTEPRRGTDSIAELRSNDSTPRGCPAPEAFLPPAPPRGTPPATCPQPQESPQQRQTWEDNPFALTGHPVGLRVDGVTGDLPAQERRRPTPPTSWQAVRTKPRSHSPPGNANESHSEMLPHAHGYSDDRILTFSSQTQAKTNNASLGEDHFMFLQQPL